MHGNPLILTPRPPPALPPSKVRAIPIPVGLKRSETLWNLSFCWRLRTRSASIPIPPLVSSSTNSNSRSRNSTDLGCARRRANTVKWREIGVASSTPWRRRPNSSSTISSRNAARSGRRRPQSTSGFPNPKPSTCGDVGTSNWIRPKPVDVSPCLASY